MDPLVPADCDLRDFGFLALDVVRLRDSQLAIEATGDEFRAAILLWCAAWHQVPAASLPDSDPSLAMLAGYGRGAGALKEWARVRAGALRGWVKCSDGRLYHPVLAEKAREAAERKEDAAGNKERQKRWRERLKSLCAELRALGVTPPAGASVTELETMLAASRNADRNVTGDVTGDVTETFAHDVTEMGGQGQGQGQGQGSKAKSREEPRPAAPRATRLPDGWEPSEVEMAWARRERPDLDADDLRRETESFGDFWRAKAGKDGAKLDWTATWRNWIRRANASRRPFTLAAAEPPSRRELA